MADKADGSVVQDQDSLLVKRRNDNNSPGLVTLVTWLLHVNASAARGLTCVILYFLHCSFRKS